MWHLWSVWNYWRPQEIEAWGLWSAKPPCSAPAFVPQQHRKDGSIDPANDFHCLHGEQFVIIPCLQCCHLPRDLINRVCHSVGVHELATGSKLLEGHISIFMPRLEIWNVNSIGSPRQITFLGSNLIPNLLFDDKCIFKIPVIPWDFNFLPNLTMLLFKAILVTNLKGFQLMLFPL